MGGLFGIGGSSAKTDRKIQLQSWGELESLFNPLVQGGKAQTDQGTSGLTTASNYFSDIASGDSAKMSRALAPQISAIQGQTSQGVNTLNQFGSRSGGTAAAISQEGYAAQQAVQNLFDLLGPEAMKEVAAISGLQEQMGLSQTEMAANIESTRGTQAGGARQTDVPLQQAQQAGVMEALVSMFL